MKKLLTCTIVLLALLAVPCAHASALYYVTDLGAMNGSNSTALGINNSGEIVGSYSDFSGTHAFLYSGGTMQNIAQLGSSTSAAYGINSSGQIVGEYDLTGNGEPRAFLYSGGVLTNLGTLDGDETGAESHAYAINNNGQIVGSSTSTNGLGNGGMGIAFLYSNGTMASLGGPGLTSEATSINDSGQIAGDYSTNAPSSTTAFLYENGTVKAIGPQGDLTPTKASGINSNGEIAGTASSAGHFDSSAAYLYAGGIISNLSASDSSVSMYHATAINNSNQIVGWVGDGDGITNTALLYSGGAIVALNKLIDPTSGWVLERANAINDYGQIAGYGIDFKGQTHAFLLTPYPTLGIATAGSNVVVTWPAYATNCTLYASTSLSGANWLPAGGLQALVGSQIQVTLPLMLCSNRFFQLQLN
jgi:probable HAF family extracellular repeat protein